MIQSIAFVAYPVRDVAGSRPFYEQVLGLKVTHDFQGQWIEYDLGDSTFVTRSMDALPRPPVTVAAVAFEVRDFDAAIERLRAARANFKRDPFETPVCRMAVISDPDGNALIVHQRKD